VEEAAQENPVRDGDAPNKNLTAEWRIVAHLPQGDVVINQFEKIRDQEPADRTA
jgi:hypothetical protein